MTPASREKGVRPTPDCARVPTQGPAHVEDPRIKGGVYPCVYTESDRHDKLIAKSYGCGGPIEEAYANAHLIASAFTAATRLRELGYDDPIAAVEALPEVLELAEPLSDLSAKLDALLSRLRARGDGGEG